VTSEHHAGSVPRSHDEDAQVELIFEIVDAQNDRQKIDTDALRTDLSDGGSLAACRTGIFGRALECRFAAGRY
jgi:hypothetical protein